MINFLPVINKKYDVYENLALFFLCICQFDHWVNVETNKYLAMFNSESFQSRKLFYV